MKKKDPNLPVIIVTAYDSFAKDPGLAWADGYVIKNFDVLDELKQKIAEILGQKKAPHPDNNRYPFQVVRQSP
jgi:CheY-like chemotaxis protein